jgi:DNA-binding FadR family transcriptional regulator
MAERVGQSGGGRAAPSQSEGGDGMARSTRTAVDRLGRDIVAGVKYRPGQVLTLETLAEELGVTRAMMREVTQSLNEKGLIRTQPRVGAVVQPLASWAVLDPVVIDWRLDTPFSGQMQSLAELRDAIEPSATRLAALRRSPEQCRELILLSDRLMQLGSETPFDRAGFRDADARFHHTVLDCSQNELFRSLGYAIEKVMNHRIEKYVAMGLHAADAGGRPTDAGGPVRFPPNPKPVALWLHRGIAHGIDQRSSVAAEACCRALLAETRGEFRTAGVHELRTALRELDLTPTEREQFEAAAAAEQHGPV